MRRPLRRSDLLRFWLAEHGSAFGLVVALVVVVLALAPILYFILPTGPAKPVEGVITRIGFRQDDMGSYPRAVVRLPDRTISLNLPRATTCATGSIIVVQRAPTLIGQRYLAPTCKAR